MIEASLDDETLLKRLVGALKRRSIKGKVQGLKRLAAGVSSQAWTFDLSVGKKVSSFIMHRTLGEEAFDLTITRKQQAEIQAEASQCGVSIPPILFVIAAKDGLGDGHVSGYLEGETVPHKIQSDPGFKALRENFIDQTTSALATIHKTKLNKLDHIIVKDISRHLELYQKIYERNNTPVPIFDYTFNWLKANQPDEMTPCLVHGDFRMENLLVDSDKIVAVLNWENAHIGDLYEDLSWIAVPPWRYKFRDKPIAGLGDYHEFYQAYEKYSGHKVDVDRAHYWLVLNQLKWGMMCMFMTFQHITGDDPSLERAAIGRRISETEVDLIKILGLHDDVAL